MQKGVFVVLFSLAAIVSAIDLSRYANSETMAESDFQDLFREYMSMVPFFIQECPERYQHFKSQIISILNHNKDASKTWKREVNKYTGFLSHEAPEYLVMAPQNCVSKASYKPSLRNLADFPASLDWRDSGVVAPVKNQGDYSACWAFATVGAIESHWAIYMNSTSPTQFSEQQLIDCSISQDISGSFPSSAFEYVKHAGGLETENTYPYAMQQEGCIFNSSVSGALVSGSVNITAGDELSIMQALVEHGPVAALMESNADFASYTGGIYTGDSCGQNVNHAILIVGYGKDQATGMDYWICKNSWGRGWGEEGYFKIQRGKNACGIANCASFPDMSALDFISM